MVDIASNLEFASSATSGVQSVSLNSGIQVSMGISNISSMTTGAEVNNQLSADISQLVTCVKGQGQNFADIAKMFAAMDSNIKSSNQCYPS